MIRLALSGRTGGAFLRVVAGLQGCDDLFEVAGDLPVHLGQAGLAECFGRGNDLQRLLVLGAVLGQVLGGGDEDRAGQAGFSELSVSLPCVRFKNAYVRSRARWP